MLLLALLPLLILLAVGVWSAEGVDFEEREAGVELKLWSEARRDVLEELVRTGLIAWFFFRVSTSNYENV